jgi:hypothetical protein
MRTTESHDQLFKTLYYDEAWFGTITSTFKEADQTDKTKALPCVKQWFKSNLE